MLTLALIQSTRSFIKTTMSRSPCLLSLQKPNTYLDILINEAAHSSDIGKLLFVRKRAAHTLTSLYSRSSMNGKLSRKRAELTKKPSIFRMDDLYLPQITFLFVSRDNESTYLLGKEKGARMCKDRWAAMYVSFRVGTWLIRTPIKVEAWTVEP